MSYGMDRGRLRRGDSVIVAAETGLILQWAKNDPRNMRQETNSWDSVQGEWL